MKNKLRKIIIDNIEYLYSVTDNYHLGTETTTMSVKVYLSGYKLTPLIIDFLSIGHYYCLGHDYMKNPLTSGISLTNRRTKEKNQDAKKAVKVNLWGNPKQYKIKKSRLHRDF